MSNEKVAAVYDRGILHKMVVTDTEIRAVARFAVADVPMRYINQDGSTRWETPTKADLFSDQSRHSAGLLTVTYDHTEPGNPPSPETFRDVAIGMTGDTVFEEIVNGKSILSTVVAIKDARAIKAITSGTRLALSPGYWRTLAKDETEDEAEERYLQQNRKHFELAYVEEGRGGELIKLMGSAQDSTQFDPAQATDDWWGMMSADSIDQESINKAQRLLRTGSLSPPAIYLPTNKDNKPKSKTMKIKIGDRLIEVDEGSAQDVMAIDLELASTKAKLATAEAAAQDAAKLQGEVLGLKSKLEALETTAQDAVVTNKTTIDAVKRYQQTKVIFDSVKAQGRTGLDAAEKALTNYDAAGCRKAIVSVLFPESAVFDSATIDSILVGYSLHLPEPTQDAIFGYGGNGSQKMPIPADLQGYTGQNATYNQLINGSVNGGLPVGTNFLAPDTNWSRIGNFGGNQ